MFENLCCNTFIALFFIVLFLLRNLTITDHHSHSMHGKEKNEKSSRLKCFVFNKRSRLEWHEDE